MFDHLTPQQARMLLRQIHPYLRELVELLWQLDDVQQDEEVIQTTQDVNREKAVTVLYELQALAEFFIDGVVPDERRDEFIERFGLPPEHFAWFAADGEVSLDELFTMVLVGEGGSITSEETFIAFLANRIRYYSVEATGFFEQTIEDILTLEQLLSIYETGDGEVGNLAYNIINNIFAHDDSFFGARDFENRDEDLVQTAWENLTQNPEFLSSEAGEIIASIVEALLFDRDTWNSEYRANIEGEPIYTQATVENLQTQDGYRDLDALDDILETYGLGNAVPFTVGGIEVFFVNKCQDLVRRGNREAGNIIVQNVASQLFAEDGCYDCEDLRIYAPLLVASAGCCDELRDSGLDDNALSDLDC